MYHVTHPAKQNVDVLPIPFRLPPLDWTRSVWSESIRENVNVAKPYRSCLCCDKNKSYVSWGSLWFSEILRGWPGPVFHCIKHGNKGLGFIICDSHKLPQKANFSFTTRKKFSHSQGFKKAPKSSTQPYLINRTKRNEELPGKIEHNRTAMF